MALIRLKRDWFAPNGVRYLVREGLADIPDEWVGLKLLPPDCEIIDGTLPTVSKPKLPGFGAKPAHEQVLDEIAGASPTHQITADAGESQSAAQGEHTAEEKAADQEGLARAHEKANLVKDQKLDLDDKSGPSKSVSSGVSTTPVMPAESPKPAPAAAPEKVPSSKSGKADL